MGFVDNKHILKHANRVFMLYLHGNAVGYSPNVSTNSGALACKMTTMV